MTPTQQLRVLLEQWQQRRDPSLAEQIFALGNSFPDLPYQTPQSWITHAHQNDPTLTSPLLKQLPSKSRILHERLTALSAYPPDPRIGLALVGLLNHPPAQLLLGNPTRAVLTCLDRIAELLPHHADPSHAARLKASPRPRFRYQRAQTHYQNAWKRLEPWINAQPELASPPEPRHVAHTPPDLDNLEETLVYADALQARQDPRGELIALQCLSSPPPEAQARIKELQRDHYWEWTGALTGLLIPDSLVWFRGFPVQGKLQKKPLYPEPMPELLPFTNLTGDAPFSFFQSPYVQNLRVMDNLDLQVAAHLRLPRLERLSAYYPWANTASHATFQILLQTLLEGPLPLKRLVLRRDNALNVRMLSPLLKTPVMGRLLHLELMGMHQFLEIYSFLVQLPENINLKTATFDIYGTYASVKFSHRRGYWDRLELSLSYIVSTTEDFIRQFLSQLPDNALTSLHVVLSNRYGMGRIMKPEIRPYVRNQRHLDELLILEG